MGTPAFAPTFTDDQLGELLALLKDVGSVELKLTVPESDQLGAVRSLGMDPLESQLRQVYFFDTPDLQLNRHGIVVRARRVQRRGGDFVVKVRPAVPAALPPRFRDARGMNVEVDAMPGGFICSATLKRSVDNDDVAAAVVGDLPLRALSSDKQRAFFDAHRPAAVGLDGLSVLGPVLVLKLKLRDTGRPFVAEMWLFPDNSRVLELSTKCTPDDAFRAAAESRVFLSGRGIELSGDQETKTRRALEFFAARLQAGEG